MVGKRETRALLLWDEFSPITNTAELPKYSTVIETAAVLAYVKKLYIKMIIPNNAYPYNQNINPTSVGLEYVKIHIPANIKADTAMQVFIKVRYNNQLSQ